MSCVISRNCNILIDTLPLTVEIGGRDIPIYADFRTGILFEQLVQDAEIDGREKALAAIELYFPSDEVEHVLTRIDEASEQLVWFYA